MANVFLIVEGSTEEQFYKKTLQEEYIKEDGTYKHFISVTQMPSKKNTTSREKKGGRVSFDTAVTNVRRFIRSNGHCALILLILDYYGLDTTFSDHLTQDHRTLDQKVQAIQERLEQEIDHAKFRFRLQVHEFEAYLFSDAGKIAGHFGDPEVQEQLEYILAGFNDDPEAINNDVKTAPSKRLDELFPDFGKTTDGILLAEKIGVQQIRQKCRRFNEMCKLIDALP